MIIRIKDMDESVSLLWTSRDIMAMLQYTSNSSDKSSETGYLSLYLKNYYVTIENEREKNKQKESDS